MLKPASTPKRAAPRRLVRRLLPALATFSMALAAAPAANAADCSTEREAISGSGASMLHLAFNNASSGWIVNAGCVLGADSLVSFAPADKDPYPLAVTHPYAERDLVYYSPEGGGNGLGTFGGGTGTGRFAAYPGQRGGGSFAASGAGYGAGPGSPIQVAEEGSEVVPGADNEINDPDDGVIHTVPAAQGAIAVIVKTPLGCKLPAANIHRSRTRLPLGPAGRPNGFLEMIFSGEDPSPGGATPPYAVWGDLGWLTTGTTDPCTVPLRRYVRRDSSSGVVHDFKRFMEANDSGQDTAWGDHDEAGENTALWPARTTTTAGIDNDEKCDGANADWLGFKPEGDYVCASATTNGDFGVADHLNTAAAQGGIAVVDLATARAKNFGWLNTADRTYWLALYAQGGGVALLDPAIEEYGFKQGGPKGANCAYADYGVDGVDPLPANTKQNWSRVRLKAQAGVYPLCTMSYLLAWEDMNDPTGGPNDCADVGDQQESLRGLIEFILGTTAGGDDGQLLLRDLDYAALPAAVGLKAATYFHQAQFRKPPNINACTPEGG